VSVVIVGVIRQKPVLTHASIVCEGMLASVNSDASDPTNACLVIHALVKCHTGLLNRNKLHVKCTKTAP